MNMQTPRPVTKPNKQRKKIYDAPAHLRHKLLAAHLSPTLRATHIVRSFPVRSGDTIRVTRGDHKGFEGKVSRIDVKKYRIYVDGLTRDKVDGTTISVPVHPSKLIITQLNLDDKWRKKILERKQKMVKKPKGRPKKRKPEAQEKITAEKPPEIVEPKQVEEKPAIVEKPVEEAVAAAEKPEKKEVSKPRRRTKKAQDEKKEAEVAESEAEEQPEKERKTAKRKTVKKREEGEE